MSKMNVRELKERLQEMEIPETYYEINGHLLPDRYILNKISDSWEVFYHDERGNQNDYHKFYDEDEACLYLYNILKLVTLSL